MTPFRMADEISQNLVALPNVNLPLLSLLFQSCPAINVFTAENLDKALDGATRSFCDQEISIWTVQKRINVSQLFQWYGSDFGQNDIEAIR